MIVVESCRHYQNNNDGKRDRKEMLGDMQKSRKQQGKKITYVDDRYLKEAKENLYEEFSIALDIEKDNVEQYITDHL